MGFTTLEMGAEEEAREEDWMREEKKKEIEFNSTSLSFLFNTAILCNVWTCECGEDNFSRVNEINFQFLIIWN